MANPVETKSVCDADRVIEPAMNTKKPKKKLGLAQTEWFERSYGNVIVLPGP